VRTFALQFLAGLASGSAGAGWLCCLALAAERVLRSGPVQRRAALGWTMAAVAIALAALGALAIPAVLAGWFGEAMSVGWDRSAPGSWRGAPLPIIVGVVTGLPFGPVLLLAAATLVSLLAHAGMSPMRALARWRFGRGKGAAGEGRASQHSAAPQRRRKRRRRGHSP
jgi:hypothetical protein